MHEHNHTSRRTLGHTVAWLIYSIAGLSQIPIMDPTQTQVPRMQTKLTVRMCQQEVLIDMIHLKEPPPSQLSQQTKLILSS